MGKRKEKSLGHVYMRLDRFKKISAAAPRARRLGMFPGIAIMYRSRRIVWGLIFICIVAYCGSNYLVTPDVAPKCWFCSASDRAMVPGVVTKLDCIAYGAKNRNDYRVEYSYMVGGKTYTGVGYQTGLLYLEKNAVTVDYMVKDPSCSCVREMRCAADNALFTIMFGGILLAVGVLLVLTGVQRMINAIWVIEHGAIAAATVGEITRSTRRSGTLNASIIIHRWTASCRFKDSSGKSFTLDVGTPEGYLKRGDGVDVVYDPGIPENAIAIGALPWFVKSEPALMLKK
jgi:hypothetical protein